MNEEIVIAGFGGQGVLSMGMILCYSGIIEDKEVSWMPSYGPEMRGGTANCIAIISDSKISSPIIATFDTVIALNQPSVDKFEKAVKPGGLLIYESTKLINPPTSEDIYFVVITGSSEAAKMKNTKIMNMIILSQSSLILMVLSITIIYMKEKNHRNLHFFIVKTQPKEMVLKDM